MGSWRDIMDQAEAARLTMLQDRAAGERAFQELLRIYPLDGMVYFKRGEAFAGLGESALASADFEKAESFFPMQEWKERARAARTALGRGQ